MSRARLSGRLAAAVASLLLLGVAVAAELESPPVSVSIDPSRGAEKGVDYAVLAQHGPWDDRNYQLTAKDIELLPASDVELREPIPAFYRVELRKALLAAEGSGSRETPVLINYPRSALNGYLAKYGGYLINGVTHTRVQATDEGTFEIFASTAAVPDASGVLPNFVGGEVRITTPAGAAESAVAINPVNPNLVIAGTNGPGSGQKMWYSSNGGTSWSGPVSLANTCCDPAVGWSPDGTVGYAAALSTVVGGGTNVLFYRSTNNGQTWTLAKQLNTGNASDKEYFTVDMVPTSPFFGRIYMAWHDSNVQKFAWSSNGGTVWSAIATLDSASRGIGSDLATDPAGNVYFFFPATGGGSNAKNIRVLKSTNGGVSFGAGSNVSATNADFDFPIPSFETRRAFVYVSADTDRSGGTYNGSIYAAWTDTSTLENNTTASANHAVVRVGRSRDAGATWQISTPHPTGDVLTVDRFNQWLSVDRNGRVFVMYYDTRHSVNRTGTDVYYAVSTDGAQTFGTPVRLSTVTSKNINNSFEWGDYNGMDVALAEVMAIYTDNRDESGGTAESVDVYGIGGFGGTPPPANVPPVANFTFTTSGLTANFTDTSTDSDGTIASRSWNFGDGTTSTATNPAKTYTAGGTFNVQLTVTDNGGASHSVTKPVTVTAPPPPGGTVLSNGVPVTGLAAATGATLNYTVVIPSGASNLQIAISGGTGDADLYVRFGSAPTTTVYDCRPYLSGNNETCTFATPQVGTYHVMVRAYSTFSGVSLQATWSTTTIGPFFQNTADYTISDFATVESPITVTGVSGNAPSALKVAVNIVHTYIGDLKVDLIAPTGAIVATLHNRTGGSAANIVTTYTVNASAYTANGVWKLRVYDAAAGDVGYINSWSMQF